MLVFLLWSRPLKIDGPRLGYVMWWNRSNATLIYNMACSLMTPCPSLKLVFTKKSYSPKHKHLSDFKPFIENQWKCPTYKCKSWKCIGTTLLIQIDTERIFKKEARTVFSENDGNGLCNMNHYTVNIIDYTCLYTISLKFVTIIYIWNLFTEIFVTQYIAIFLRNIIPVLSPDIQQDRFPPHNYEGAKIHFGEIHCFLL